MKIDPKPKEPPPALPADLKGIIRAQQWPDRVGYKCLDDAKGLMKNIYRLYSVKF